jgi:7-cyano-7-deazaguanine synthase
MTKAIVLLSGGLDSTVVLALALADGKECFALSFDYDQRHILELNAAAQIARHYHVPHKIIKIHPTTFEESNSTLNSKSSDSPIPKNRTLEQMGRQGIPSTYVPARNTLFLSYALGQCEMRGAQEIHFGPNKMDFAGYPDCRPAYLEAFQFLMSLAVKPTPEGSPLKLITPLIQWDKAEIIRQGLALGAPLDLSFSCYNPCNEKPCGECDPCILRADGFARQ